MSEHRPRRANGTRWHRDKTQGGLNTSNGQGKNMSKGGDTLGAEGVLPGRHIESFLRVFKQFTHTIPRGQMVGKFSIYPPL